MSFLPQSLKIPILHGTELIRRSLGNISWGPALSISKAAANSIFSRLENGQLIIVDETSGSSDVYGQPAVNSTANKSNSSLSVKLIVKKETFWVRLLLFADMGFAESYMLGEVQCSDLTKFFSLFILNRKQLGDATTLTSSLSSTITGLARSTNTLSNSLLNVSAHYDISNDMFAAFLSQDMTYSCAIWEPESSGISVHETLEEAQITKLTRFINGAHIKSTDHVLEIGTGWGSFAIEAVRRTGCRVTSMTLSIEQKALAEQRIAEAGFAERIEVKLMDYRALPVPEQPYDKVVSIEMLEAVGREFLETYFGCVHKLLKPNGGIAMFQCITMPEGRYEAYSRGEDFIRKYIFPGGHLPSISQLISSISKGSDGTLIVEKVENIGGHYAKTLRLWREKFLKNFDKQIRPALMAQHEYMDEKEVEVFRRKWEYYFTYCEAGFATKTLGDVIITVGREGAMELMEEIPL